MKEYFRCYFCSKLRPARHCKVVTILGNKSVKVCDDKYINDCNTSDIERPQGCIS